MTFFQNSTLLFLNFGLYCRANDNTIIYVALQLITELIDVVPKDDIEYVTRTKCILVINFKILH